MAIAYAININVVNCWKGTKGYQPELVAVYSDGPQYATGPIYASRKAAEEYGERMRDNAETFFE